MDDGRTRQMALGPNRRSVRVYALGTATDCLPCAIIWYRWYVLCAPAQKSEVNVSIYEYRRSRSTRSPATGSTLARAAFSFVETARYHPSVVKIQDHIHSAYL